MSVGLYRHPTLGEAKKYILNNKHVLEIKLDTKQTEDWARQFASFKESYLRNKQLKFYLLPEEVYIDREAVYEYEESSKMESVRVVVYEHFVVTLKEELQMRIKTQQAFTKNELWFFLYALTCAAMEAIQIQEIASPGEELEINQETILLNQYGYIKLVGYFSTPFSPKCRASYKSPQSHLSVEALPQKLQICCSASIGRIIASLALLRQMDEFIDTKLKLFSDTKILEELKPLEEKLGVFYNILKLMLADNLNQRLMISEAKGLLLPYQDDILALKDFTFDRQTSRESMMQLFVNQ